MMLLQCGGGGGGGGGGSTSSFIAESMSYGRGIDEGSGLTVVSPLTLVDADPVTGLLVPGSLRPLGQGIDVSTLVTVGLGTTFRPVVIPRNGILVVHFASPVDASSVIADELTDAGKVIHAGSVQVRLQNGRGVPVQLIVKGSDLLINAAINGTVGFPASPVVFGADGEPVPDATGFLRVIFPVSGDHVVRSATGEALVARADELGTSGTPIGLNPGNAELDFIEQNDLFPSNQTFNGFLPDVTAPRIVRDYFVRGTIDLASGDSFASNSLTDVAQSFSSIANGGKGEWANKLLVLRPGQADGEQHKVASNTDTTVVIEGTFTNPPRDGDSYKLSRAEFFEPQPSDPIDPDFFDSDNPQNENNRDLRFFVTFDEIDAKGKVSDANGDGRTEYTSFEPVPSRSIAQVRFSEPIDIATVLAFESFRVTDDPEPDDPGFEHLGVAFEEKGATVISYVAKRSIQANDSQSEYQGFLPSPDGSERIGALRLTLRVVPDLGYLRERMSRDQFNAFVAHGYRGLTDLGGRPLAFSNADFDPTIGYIDYSFDFAAQTIGGQTYRNIGGVVHLFQGVPVSGNDPYSGEPGVHFADRADFYGPRLADINLRANGFLSGAAVTFIQKPLDDDNPPPDGQFFPYPFGVAKPLNLIDGGRFQHVYRPLEASPSPFDLKGSLLDLRKVSWAPIGGNVTDDTYENIAIYAAHSEVVPITSQSAGVPDDSFSGLGQALDPETPFTYCDTTPTQKKQNYVAPLQNCVPNGTQYFVKQANLFAPPGDSHAYEPWPDFQDRFPYNNQDSLMLEYRIHPQATLISFANGFTFSPGILSTPLPRFRAFTFGTQAAPLNPDDKTDPRQKCAQDDGSAGKFGDNSRYFAVFDFVKITSRIQSGFIGVTGTATPDYFDPTFDPPLESLPEGTKAKIEYQGADGAAGLVKSPWTENINDLDLNWRFIRFRVTLVGNESTLLNPSFDSIVIPYLR